MTFTNGALLPPEITIEKLKQSHASIPMNPLIASVFYKAGLIENWGRGTINVIADCANYGIPEPEFRFDMNVFWAILHNDTNDVTDDVTDNVTDDRLKQVLELIKKQKSISTAKIGKILNVSKRTVLRDIEKLKATNRIKRIGDERTGYWELIDSV